MAKTPLTLTNYGRFKSLRQRIRPTKINCCPWNRYKSIIKPLPISSKCLFSKKGLNWDVLETELKEEKWLDENENLLEVIELNSNLLRLNLYELEPKFEDPFDETWTDEDYECFYNKNGL